MAVDVTPDEQDRIEALARSARPLVVVDIDEVVLEFVAPFMAFLDANGHELRPTSFRLTGNIYAKDSGQVIEKDVVSGFLEAFFGEHDTWQAPVVGARDTLEGIAAAHDADIVFLTAMPPRHHARRRTLLDRHGFDHPMIATEEAKGSAVRALTRDNPGKPVAFIDDLPKNHLSVLDAVPGALALQLMAFEPLRRHLPPMPAGVTSVADWSAVADAIAGHFTRHGR